MRAKLICSLTVFSILFSPAVNAEQTASTAPKVRKKPKAHFVGSKRPPQNEPVEAAPTDQPKRTSRVKNDWVVSKTYPKADRKEAEVKHPSSMSHRTSSLLANNAPNIYTAQQSAPIDQTQRIIDLERKLGALQAQVDELQHPDDGSYPRTGVYAPKGGFYFTGEWLFWQTREGGLEFAVERSSSSPGVFTDAVPKKLEFDWQSGFRVGFGVHLPHDGWDIYASYTNFQPDASRHADESVFPLLAFQEQFPLANVTGAHAHLGINFQTADLEIGRAYYLAQSLALRPYIGCKGAWIHQHAHVNYTGGDVPSGEEFKINTHNDYKGAGLRFGIGSNWEWCCGLSFVSNLSGAVLIGHFDLSQDQELPDHTKTIDIDSDFNLLNPMAQLSFGVAWDRNFCKDRCHFGISLSFESQYWWRQNQLERFTDSAAPIYVRPDEDLGFYGINLMARLDF